MSALLPLSERVYELNLSAEHGYAYRSFQRRVRVFQSPDYKSAMFLVYVTYANRLPNRKAPYYRNHFTLYRSADSVVVVRSETTLNYQDHDAALQYDVIRPTESYRAQTERGWTVSFDKIDYTDKRPAFLTYSLVSSGEWWYFDTGVVLNGVTAYERDAECGTVFIYYELHPRYNIVTAPSSRDSWRTRLLAAASDSSSLPPSVGRRSRQTAASRRSAVTDDTAASTTTTTTTTTTTNTTTPTAGCNPRTQLCSFLATSSSGSSYSVVQTTTLNSNVTPVVNALARPIVHANETREVPDLDTKNVVPSMFWFDRRSSEFENGSIAYFLPHDLRLAPPQFGRASFLDTAYYNAGVPLVSTLDAADPPLLPPPTTTPRPTV